MREHEVDSYQESLKAYSYPFPIKIASLALIGLFLYALHLTPTYISAIKDLNKGKELLKQEKYKKAIGRFEQVLVKFPSSKKTKINLAISYFSLKEPTYDQEALYYLSGITLREYEWKRVKAVMPVEYEAEFETVSK